MHDVYYAYAKNYDSKVLDDALLSVFLPCVESIGGVNGKRVMIKPNFLEWKGHDKPENWA